MPGDGIFLWVRICDVIGVHNHWNGSTLCGQRESSRDCCYRTVGLHFFSLYSQRAYPFSFPSPYFKPRWLTSFIYCLSSAALFLLFTTMLVVTHINMILKGQTTVESVQIMNMKERENRRLAKGFECWEFGSVVLYIYIYGIRLTDSRMRWYLVRSGENKRNGIKSGVG